MLSYLSSIIQIAKITSINNFINAEDDVNDVQDEF